jgi:acyl CoA:acetate/3-ketoacid CoA transferase beta subunit
MTGSNEVTRAEVCAVACADIFRDSGEVLASAFGIIPAIGVRLARATFAPDLVLTDGEAHVVAGTWAVGAPAAGTVEAWSPFRGIFDLVWKGCRTIVMTPAQIDRYGNVNISSLGDHDRPRTQLVGVRGAPGNTVHHSTSYWVPRHATRSFVPQVDFVSGAGYDSVRKAGPAAEKYHRLERVVTNLAVLDFEPESGAMRLVSVHPGSSVDEVRENTGFELIVEGEVPFSRLPTDEELRLIREVIDPRALRDKEVPA